LPPKTTRRHNRKKIIVPTPLQENPRLNSIKASLLPPKPMEKITLHQCLESNKTAPQHHIVNLTKTHQNLRKKPANQNTK